MGRVRSHVDDLRGLAIQTGNSRQERGVLSSIPVQGAGLNNLIEPAHRLDVVDQIRGALVDASGEPRTAAKPSQSELWKCRGCGKVENQKQVSHFPTAPSRYFKKKPK